MSASTFTEKRFGDIARVIPGYAFKSDDFGDEGFPVVKIAEITPPRVELTNCQRISADKVVGLDRFKLAQNDILIAMTGATLGKVGRLKDNVIAYVNQRVAKIDSIEGISDKDFLYYLVSENTNKSQIIELGPGSAQANFSGRDLDNLQFLVPDLPMQRRIAAILSSLDDKIELNCQINATIEATAQAIFKEWFEKFRFPSYTGEMQESELGPIPKGWRVGKLGDVVEINPSPSLKKGSTAKYVEMKDLSQTAMSIEKFREREFSSGSKFQNGDTLLARITPCLENGKTGFVDFMSNGEIGWGSTEFIVLRGKNYINPYYVYCLSRQPSFREFAIKSMVGSSGRQRVVESILNEFPITIPDKGTLDVFSKTVSEQFSLIRNNSKESSTLAQIRDNLLPKLMSGEIEV